jgi:anti-anti-sigma factor
MSDLSNGRLRVSLTAAGDAADVHVVRLDGAVDTITAPEVDTVIASLVSQRRLRIVLDLAGVGYISSAGWGVFVSRLREIREGGGDLKLARMTPDVREIYNLLEFEGVLPHFDHLESAQAAFNGGNGHSAPRPSTVAAAIPALSRPQTGPSPNPLGIPQLDAAVLQLVLEDPFYSLVEIKARLAELGHHAVGYWTVWTILRRHRLLSRRRRFRHFRRHQMGMPMVQSR